MLRTDVINQIARAIGARRYLEIGIGDPQANFANIQCPDKTGIDPATPAAEGPGWRILQTTSDAFFEAYSGPPFDLIFVDGNHQYPQVDRDVGNAARVSSLGAYVVMHDCNPPDRGHLSPNLCGEPFQVLARWRRGGTPGFCVDCDYGVGVLRPHPGGGPAGPRPTYDDLVADRPGLIGIVPAGIFRQQGHVALLADGWRPPLTIGMATYDDFDGVYFTLASLRLHHGFTDEVEIVVVDNNPASPHGREVESYLEAWWPSSRYVPWTDKRSTSVRDQIFREAAGPIVLCCDCHVLFAPGAIQALVDWFGQHPDSRDLVQGPLLGDGGAVMATHLDPVWRGEMLGVWAQAFACPCGCAFSPVERPEDGLEYRPLAMPWTGEPLRCCPDCGRELPELGWAGHQTGLAAAGFRPLGHPADPPFEVPMMGLGAFACRREAWPGLNPLLRGFGSEEAYLHEKFRRAGGRCLCLPPLAWVHRFRRVGGPPYRITVEEKLRNYLIGHAELGWDPVPAIEHFGGRCPPQNVLATVRATEDEVRAAA